jgi:4'-phosphopantetheinyl transferase
VHVWWADLDRVGDEVLEALSPEERARGERVLSERRRERWMRSRAVLRHLLARYLRSDARTLHFQVEAGGRPTLQNASGAGPPAFSLSHSGCTALYAISGIGAVGIDVEIAGKPTRRTIMAERILPGSDTRRLEGLDPPARERELLRRWTRHEALLKWRAAERRLSGASKSAIGPRTVEFDAGAHAIAALACDCEPARLLLWSWCA